ncbi:ABC transporter permease subunit [Paraburkholderia sediminicola]|uniref:ABC transporter permease subunit n=1 Tax=Paraburkholderia sediminicola TaxID=458836 RepID=UPI0038B96668
MQDRSLLRETSVASWVFQAAVIAGLAGLAIYLGMTTWERMHSQGIVYGFDILFRPTGWQISSPFLNQTSDDPYWWTMVVAFVNTLGASLVGIVLASLLGFWIGFGLLAGNRVISRTCAVYVQIFRNVPLVLQALFWYAILNNLPAPRDQSLAFLKAIFVTNQGVFVPSVSVGALSGWGAPAAAVAVLALIFLPFHPMARRGRVWWKPAAVGIVLAGSIIAGYSIVFGAPVVLGMPELAGFGYVGGIDIPLELIALVLATVVFSAAYIAEIVRGGLQSVPLGLVEAAQALGLPGRVVLLKVRFPVALRSMVPALSNIFLFVVKATAIGSAIGYSEVYSASVVSISQTGQSVEFLLIMMLVYFILNYSITLLMNWLNRAIAFKGKSK